MKKNIFSSICLIFFSLIVSAQSSWQWAKHIGGPGMDFSYIGHLDNLHNIYLYGIYAFPYAATNYNNCYIANDTLFGSRDAFVAKYDASGNLLWVKNIVSPSGSVGLGFAFDTLNNVFYLTGSYDISCNIDTCNLYSGFFNTGFLAKLDTNGNCIWAKNIATPSMASTTADFLTVDDNGNVYMIGHSNVINTIDTSTVYPGTFLAKFDSNGNNLWAVTKLFTGSQSELHFNSLRYFDNDIYASGSAYAASKNDTITIDTVSVTNNYGSGYNIVCMDAGNSTAKWIKLDGMPNSPSGFMDIDPNGNIYVTGYFVDTIIISQDTLISNSISNGFLSKYNSNGNLQFVKQFYSTNGIGGVGVSVLRNDGSILLTGAFSGQGTLGNYTVNANTSQDLFIARFDSNGDCMGVNHAGIGMGFNIAGDEHGIYVAGVFPPQGTISGSISIAGNTFTNYGWRDIIFAKHDLISGTGEIRVTDNNILIIYANPNNGSFRLKVPKEFIHEKNLTLSIFDNTGKLIRKQTLYINEEHPRLDIFGESKGAYNVTLSNGRKTYYGRMIVD